MTTPKRNIHGSKVMSCIWWDVEGVIYYEILEPILYQRQLMWSSTKTTGMVSLWRIEGSWRKVSGPCPKWRLLWIEHNVPFSWKKSPKIRITGVYEYALPFLVGKFNVSKYHRIARITSSDCFGGWLKAIMNDYLVGSLTANHFNARQIWKSNQQLTEGWAFSEKLISNSFLQSFWTTLLVPDHN